MPRNPNVVKPSHRACIGCGETFPVSNRERNERKWCSGTCRSRTVRGTDLTAKTPARNVVGSCSNCGKQMRINEHSSPIPRCHECRRADNPRGNKTPCLNCGQPSYGERCRACRDNQQRSGAVHEDERARKREIQRRRVERDKQAPGIYNSTARAKLLAKWMRQGKRCAYCDAQATTVDHVLPLALGGTNHEGNLVPACRQCNHLKMDNLLSAWRYGIHVRKWRTPVDVKPPQPKPAKQARIPVQTTLRMCQHCTALTERRVFCSAECAAAANRQAMRERYRRKAGIPLDAPLYQGMRDPHIRLNAEQPPTLPVG